MATKFNLQQISSLTGRKILFDANILIYLFWPTGRYHWESKYAGAYNRLRQQGNELLVDFLMISEVINRVMRIEYSKLTTNINYKDFRNSDIGKETLNDIYLIVGDNVLRNFDVIGKAFDKQEILRFLTVDELDFVDKATVALCEENSLVLLTNDSDFKLSGIDILTSNPALLRST